jgi:hypothetical protein
MSQPLEEFILYTGWIWTRTITPFGLCFSFETDEKVFVSGSAAGLQVWTWLDQESYRLSTRWAGVRVFVSAASNKIASSQTNGAVRIPPGTASYVSLVLQEIHREEQAPWSYCISGEESVENCRMNCIFDITSMKCGCRLIGDNSPSSLSYCTSSEYSCTSTLTEADLEVCGTSCSYLLPCQERQYQTTYSAGQISQNFAQYLESELGLSTVELANNFASIHINYESIQYDETTETKSTSPSQLFSNLADPLVSSWVYHW